MREELFGRGNPFHSRSDTEVIINGWHAWGARIFSRLRGMFALAIWDRRSGRLILARDRLGKKPLYYAANKDGLVFVHELEAYAAARVAELSGGAQHPIAGRPPTIRLFPIAKP